MKNAYIRKIHSSVSFKFSHSKTNLNEFIPVKSKTNFNPKKAAQFDYLDLKKLETTESTVKPILFEEYVSYFFTKVEYMIMCLYDIIKYFENSFLDLEVEIIQKGKIIQEKNVSIQNMMRIVPKFSYRFTKEIKGEIYNRSTSPRKSYSKYREKKPFNQENFNDVKVTNNDNIDLNLLDYRQELELIYLKKVKRNSL
jgi:hypothetical protein